MELEMLVAFSDSSASILPLSEAALADRFDELESMLHTLPPLLEYRSPMDAVAAALLPCLAPHIEAFYEGDGTRLAELYSDDELRDLDGIRAGRIETIVAFISSCYFVGDPEPDPQRFRRS